MCDLINSQQEVWDSREDALEFYMKAMAGSEGSEQQNYGVDDACNRSLTAIIDIGHCAGNGTQAIQMAITTDKMLRHQV